MIMRFTFGNEWWVGAAVLVVALGFILEVTHDVCTAKKTEQDVARHGGTTSDPRYSTRRRWGYIGITTACVVFVLGVVNVFTWMGTSDPATGRPVTAGAVAKAAFGFEEHTRYPLTLGISIGGSSIDTSVAAYGRYVTLSADGTPASAIVIDFKPSSPDEAILELPTLRIKPHVIPDDQRETYTVTFNDDSLGQGTYYDRRYAPCKFSIHNLIFAWCTHSYTEKLVVSGNLRSAGLPTFMRDHLTRADVYLHASTRDRLYGFNSTPATPTPATGN